MERVILHSDLNSFYASVEGLYRPELRGKPLVVGGDPQERHGIVLAANPAAKRFGIKTGDALWQAQQKCPPATIVPPDFKKYLRFSRLARSIYNDYTDRVEPYGIDECWLDVTGSMGLLGSGEHIAAELRRRIREELGITVSVGVSFNKVFAKLGSDYKKPDATTVISREGFREIAWPLPAGDLLCVGPATRRKLAGYGVTTIGHIAGTAPELLCRWLGKWGGVLWSFANGMDAAPVCASGEGALIKSVGNSTTTPRDLISDEDVRSVLSILADSVAARLREQGLRGRLVTISVRDKNLRRYTHQGAMDTASCLTGEITRQAITLFTESYDWRAPIRSIGLHVGQLSGSGEPLQLSLLVDEQKRAQLERIEHTVDGLRGRFGNHCVRRAVQLEDEAFARLDPKGEHVIHPAGYF